MTRALIRIASVLCPLMLAAFPLLSLFVQNQTDVELSVLWWPLALVSAAVVAIYALFLLFTRSAAKAGVLTSLIVVTFFYYGLFADRPGLFLALWLAAATAALVLLVRTKRDLGNLMLVLGAAAAVMALPRVVSLAVYQAKHPVVSAADPRLWPTQLPTPDVPAGTQLPDIYVISPDDYARPDVLKKYFKYDDSEFVRQLESRGFVISKQGRSPYSDSESNMAALLNMDYLSSFANVLGKTSEDVRPVKRVSEDNRAERLLATLGYQYVHLDTDEVTYAGGNPDVSPLATPDSLVNLWLQRSVLVSLGGPFGFNQTARDERYRNAITSVFEKLTAVPDDSRPKFVVFHTLLPHDPYVFDAQGQPVTFPGQNEEDLASDTGRRYYRDQLQFVSQKLLESVDQILAQASTPPVIVVQADEGFQANSEPFGEAAMNDMRVKGLSAFYLPGTTGPGVPSPPNSVNALRFVFNHYLGTHYPMLPSASYLDGDFPYQFEEIQVRP